MTTNNIIAIKIMILQMALLATLSCCGYDNRGIHEQENPSVIETLPPENLEYSTSITEVMKDTSTFFSTATLPNDISPSPTQDSIPLNFSSDSVYKLGDNKAWDIIIDEFGNPWTMGPNVIIKWDINDVNNSIAYHFIQTSQQRSFTSLTLSEDNAIWLATVRNGVFKYSEDTWINITRPELPSNNIDYLTAGKDGTLWAIASADRDSGEEDPSGYLGYIDGSEWNTVYNYNFFRISLASDGVVWIIPHSPQLYPKDFGDIVYFRDGELGGKTVYDGRISFTAINASLDGIIWVAGDGRVFRSNESIYSQVTTPWINYKDDMDISDIAAGSDGTAWFGASIYNFASGYKCKDIDNELNEMGVYYYDGNTWTHYTMDDGLPSNNICDLTIAPDGTVWAGTYDQGIAHFDGAHWTSYKLTIPAE